VKEGEKCLDPKEQLAVWVDQYGDRLTHLAHTYVRDWAKAEDVVQEAFIKAYRAMDRMKSPDTPLPWGNEDQIDTWTGEITQISQEG